jgi:hypothetical protein
MAMQNATASFDGSQDSVAVTWPTMTGNYGINHGLAITDAAGPVSIWLTSVSSSGATVNTSARFTGAVDLAIYDKP